MEKELELNRTYKYLRVSTDEQAKSGLGREAQLAAINQYCIFKGDKLPPVLEDPFVDDGVSSTVKILKRRAANALHLRLRSGDHVVIAKLDRLARDLRNLRDVLDIWDDMGVTVHMLDVAGAVVDTKTSMGKLIINIIAMFAEFERDKISERTKSALAAWKARGSPTKCPMAGMGWRLARDNKANKSVPKPYDFEQDQMKYIWDMRQGGMDFEQLRCHLNKTGNHWMMWTARKNPSAIQKHGRYLKQPKPWGVWRVKLAYLTYLADHIELWDEAKYLPKKSDFRALGERTLARIKKTTIHDPEVVAIQRAKGRNV